MLEVGGEGLLRAISSGETEPKVIGNAGEFAGINETLFARVKESIEPSGQEKWIVLVLADISDAKQARAVGETWSQAGIKLSAILGRAAIAERVARLAPLPGGTQAWLLDVLTDSLVLWKLDGTSSPQTVEFAFQDWMARQHGRVRAAFRESARCDIREMGGTEDEIESWLQANWQRIWEADKPVEWVVSDKARPRIDAKVVRAKLEPLSEENARAIAESCAPLIKHGSTLFVETTLTNRMNGSALLAKMLPGINLEVLPSAKKFSVLESWVTGVAEPAPETVLWANLRLDATERLEAPKVEAKTSRQANDVSTLKRKNKQMAVAVASLSLVVVAMLATTLLKKGGVTPAAPSTNEVVVKQSEASNVVGQIVETNQTVASSEQPDTFAPSTPLDFEDVKGQVNVRTLNFFVPVTILSLPCAMPIEIRAAYNSYSGDSSIFGPKWTFNHNIRVIPKRTQILVMEGDGFENYYTKEKDQQEAKENLVDQLITARRKLDSKSGSIKPDATYDDIRRKLLIDDSFRNQQETTLLPAKSLEPGVFYSFLRGPTTLELKSDGSFVRTFLNKSVEYFNRDGQLIRSVDKYNHAINYKYAGKNLVKITDDCGGWVAFFYKSDPAMAALVDSIRDSLGREAKFDFFPKAVRGYLGVMHRDLSEALAKQVGVKITHGVLLTAITPNASADKAGMKTNDVIVEFNGIPVEETRTLNKQVGDAVPGARVPVKISRIENGKPVEKVIQVTLQQRPGSLDPQPKLKGFSTTTKAAEFTYDGVGNMLSITNTVKSGYSRNRASAVLTYNSQYEIQSQTDSDGLETRFTRSYVDNDPNHSITESSKFRSGKLLARTVQEVKLRELEIVTQFDADGKEISQETKKLSPSTGYPISTLDDKGRGELVTYDPSTGNPIRRELLPSGDVTEYEYDTTCHQVSKVTTSRNGTEVSVEKFRYDPSCNPLRVEEVRGSEKTVSIALTWNEQGKLSSLLDEIGHREIVFTYVRFGKTESITLRDTGTLRVKYTSTGEIQKVDTFPDGKGKERFNAMETVKANGIILSEVKGALDSIMATLKPSGINVGL